MKRLAALLCCVLVGCSSGGDSCADGGGSGCVATECASDDGGALDCSAMCANYCEKKRTCGVMATDSCQDDCVTITEAGSSTSEHACVITKTCEEISTCGI